MWLFTTQGFYSVVEHRDDPELLIVRSRAREDIEALREQIPQAEPFEDQADYPWRAYVRRDDWAAAVAAAAREINYDNFKSAVAHRQGAERSRAYGQVWAVLKPFG